MTALYYISDLIIPVLIFYIVAYGIIMKANIYDDFIKGAEDGFKTVIQIMPTLIGLMVAVGILRASGFLDFISAGIGRLTEGFGVPGELLPLSIVRLFSSSASTSIILDIFKTHGPDSEIGLMSSIMSSCTESIFYTMSVYFMTAKVTKTRYTLAGGLLSALSGVIFSILLTRFMLP